MKPISVSALLLILIFVFGIQSCGDDNEPKGFKIFTLQSADGLDSLSKDGTSISRTITWKNQYFEVFIIGQYSNIVFNSDCDWLTASVKGNAITVTAEEFYSVFGSSRTGVIKFTVLEDAKSESGSISVTQTFPTVENSLAVEKEYIASYLKDKVVEKLPDNLEHIEFGDGAPFYQLDSEIYVQFVYISPNHTFKDGDLIAIATDSRSYNLRRFSEEGKMPYSDYVYSLVSQSPYYVFGDNSYSEVPADNNEKWAETWGEAIHNTLSLGILGYYTRINLIVPSIYGPKEYFDSGVPRLWAIEYYYPKDFNLITGAGWHGIGWQMYPDNEIHYASLRGKVLYIGLDYRYKFPQRVPEIYHEITDSDVCDFEPFECPTTSASVKNYSWFRFQPKAIGQVRFRSYTKPQFMTETLDDYITIEITE